MSARAVAVIRPAANIISRLAFLYILSSQGQLHALRTRFDVKDRLCDDEQLETLTRVSTRYRLTLARITEQRTVKSSASLSLYEAPDSATV